MSSFMTFPPDVQLVGGDNPVTTFGGTAPSKFGRAKNAHNFVRFTTALTLTANGPDKDIDK